MNATLTRLAEKIVEVGYAVRTLAAPDPFRPLDPAHDRWIYQSPDEFYAIPAQPPDLQFTPLAEAKGERLVRFRFPSTFTSPYPENNMVHGLADLRPEGTAHAALIFLHGHMMTRATLFPMLWYSRQVIREGFDIYYMNLPYHMLRRPRGSYGGQYTLSSDMPGSALAFMQGVRDVRSLLTWIEHTSHFPVALAGISLGAYTACMTAAVDSRPQAVVSVLGGASLARIPWDGYQGGKTRRQLEAHGITFEQLEAAWKLASPGSWKPKLDPGRVLLIAGSYDRIVTPANVEKLWEAWDRPQIRWYLCGHVTSAVYHREISHEMSDFLERSCARAVYT
jgi:pimeloyl-ACP methyl ester carboxylesterase